MELVEKEDFVEKVCGLSSSLQLNKICLFFILLVDHVTRRRDCSKVNRTHTRTQTAGERGERGSVGPRGATYIFFSLFIALDRVENISLR